MFSGNDLSESASSPSIRLLASSDVPAVMAILQESPEAAMWSRESLLATLSGEPPAWVAEWIGCVAGFLIGRVVADDFEILNMAVARASRRAGIGSKLIVQALNVARDAGAVRAYLEVRASNLSALSFYMRHGFTQCGKRVRYYRDPMDDALLLSLRLDRWKGN